MNNLQGTISYNVFWVFFLLDVTGHPLQVAHGTDVLHQRSN